MSAAFFLAQNALRAADSFARYSGVSHFARLVLYASEFMVSFNLALRWAKASGSDIFSRLRSWAARIPATLRFRISGSVFSTLCCVRSGWVASSNRMRWRLASSTSFRGATTPSPPSVKFASVPPSAIRLKCAMSDRSIAQASSQDIFRNLCTRIFSGPYRCTRRKHIAFRSFFFVLEGSQRADVFPMPT